MPRRQPDVVSGARGPEHFPERRDDQVDAIEVKKTRPQERVYQSAVANLRVQIRTEPDQFIGGRVMPGKNVAAQFDRGIYRTSNPEYIEVLDSGPRYGIGGLYWDAEELQAQVQTAQDDAAKAAIVANKELIRDLVKSGQISKADLDDFVLEAQG